MSDLTARREAAHGTSDPVTFAVDVPVGVKVIRLDLSRERVIRVVGRDRRGTRVERLLKVTGKGRILLV